MTCCHAPVISKGRVKSVTYGTIDTIFILERFLRKNMRFRQYPCGFYDLSKIAIFVSIKKTFFVITQVACFSAFEVEKRGGFVGNGPEWSKQRV
jgi:hypothetical protein